MSAVMTAPECASPACDSTAPGFGRAFDWATCGNNGNNGHNGSVNGSAEPDARDAIGAGGAGPIPEPSAPGAEVGPPTVDSNGHLLEDVLTDADRNYAVFLHLSPLAFMWVGPFALVIPLVMWLSKKDESRFISDHGRETVNFMITWALLSVVLVWTIVVPVVMAVVLIVSVIRGSIAASRREYFRYPMTIRFLT